MTPAYRGRRRAGMAFVSVAMCHARAMTVAVFAGPIRPTRAARQVVTRVAVMLAVVAAVAAVHLRHRPPTLCLLRAVTGVPCPFCGGTTAAVDLGHGRLVDALRASPLAVALIGVWPFAGLPRPRWVGSNRGLVRIGIVVALVAAEVWQLHRFGLLPA